jgi:hypothetical protein
MGEIDVAMSMSSDDEEDVLPSPNEGEPPLTSPGDLWLLEDQARDRIAFTR